MDQPPTPGNGAPNPSSRPTQRFRAWWAVAWALTAAIAVTALVIALTRPKLSAPSEHAETKATVTYTSAEIGAAQRQLCDTYALVARAVQVDTSGTDKALARIADTNGAVLLNMAAANAALDASHRDAARALATAYATVTAKSNGTVASDADYQAAIDDVISKDSAMKRVCGAS
ncbi:hypothetical protein [Mycobacterium europaeum]|uniref:hypothetical protein n=1 Tax=Mycobacterium europaeum TaxID=761804 RepID=UPI000B851AEE|nr:hypothetical protein [Mycobacterium europaeum]